MEENQSTPIEKPLSSEPNKNEIQTKPCNPEAPYPQRLVP